MLEVQYQSDLFRAPEMYLMSACALRRPSSLWNLRLGTLGIRSAEIHSLRLRPFTIRSELQFEHITLHKV
jgi:hypothetical protein